MEIKKGQITQTQIFIFIILIVSFVILLIFLSKVFSGDTNPKVAACKTSVLLRGSLNAGKFAEPGRNSIPLNCETEKICLTNSKDLCKEQYPGLSNDDFFTRYRISSDKDKVKEEAMEKTAEALMRCHDMLGRGEVDFFPKEWQSNNYCVICSRIAFDEGIKESLNDVSLMDFYVYLSNKKTSDGKSYLEELYGIKEVRTIPLIFNGIKESDEFAKQKELFNGELFSPEDIRLFYSNDNAIIVQVVTQGKWGAYSAAGIAVGAGIFLTGLALTPFTGGGSFAASIAAITVLKVGVAATSVGAVVAYSHYLPNGGVYNSPVIYPYSPQELNNLGCSSFEELP